jgi:hypothetical protein
MIAPTAAVPAGIAPRMRAMSSAVPMRLLQRLRIESRQPRTSLRRRDGLLFGGVRGGGLGLQFLDRVDRGVQGELALAVGVE